MGPTKPFPRLAFGWRVLILTILSGVINLLINSTAFSMWIKNHLALIFKSFTNGEVDYFVFVIQALFSGLLLILLVLSVTWLEKPTHFRQFFKIGPFDLKGFGLMVLFTALLDALEILFLRRLVYEPVRLFLASLGLPGQASLNTGFTPDPHLMGINILLLLLIFWIEAPEEIFFRGYVQNHLQDHIGPNLALFLGAFIWTGWHFFAIADFLHILLFGLAFSFVFRLRQNTTPLAIWHPLGNRLLLLFSFIGIWLAQIK